MLWEWQDGGAGRMERKGGSKGGRRRKRKDGWREGAKREIKRLK